VIQSSVLNPQSSGTALARLGAACLALVIVAGSVFLWIGVPVGGFWLAGRVTTHQQDFLFLVLGAIPLAMVFVGWALYRVNSVYESLRRHDRETGSRSAWLVSLSDERAGVRRQRGRRTLLDVAMTASASAAIVVALVWFFFFAETRLAPLP
jgi:hypothetical protein